MNYSLIVANNNLNVTKEFNNMIFDRMETESNFIMNTLENFQVVFEEAEEATNDTSQKGFFEKLAEFFKKLFGVFSEKTKSLFEFNKKWMDDNFNKFDKIDYTQLKIQMIPFWNMTMNNLKADSYTIQKRIEKAMSNKQNLEKYKDLESFKKEFYSEYLDANGDLTNGLKNYYRVGNSKGPIESVALEGIKLKEKVQEFKTYCFNYGKDIQPFVKALMDISEKELQRIEKMLKNRPTTENFCLVENTFYVNTDISQYDGFIVLEAEQPKEDTVKKPDTPANHTQVQIVNKNDPEQKSEDEDASTQKYSGLSTAELVFLKNAMQINQLSVSAMMTVLEERFKAYMNALKAIIKEAGSTTDNSPKNTQKNDNDTKK